jgi:hypothetical protein
MCNPYTTPEEQRPDAKLASLLNRDLGTEISPREMSMFIRANWKLVCAYAHAIHDAEARPSDDTDYSKNAQ